MRRRELLLSALALKAAPASAATKGEWRNKQSGMAYRQLGRTGYMVSEVVMGGNTISPKNYDHVLAAIDLGLNYLDTAPAYGGGQSELGYAEVLKVRKRDKLFINSKVSIWDVNRNRLYQDIYKSLDETEQKRLRGLALEEIARRKADAPEYFINYFNGQRDELDAASLANVMAKQYGERIDRGRLAALCPVGEVDDTNVHAVVVTVLDDPIDRGNHPGDVGSAVGGCDLDRGDPRIRGNAAVGGSGSVGLGHGECAVLARNEAGHECAVASRVEVAQVRRLRFERKDPDHR